MRIVKTTLWDSIPDEVVDKIVEALNDDRVISCTKQGKELTITFAAHIDDDAIIKIGMLMGAIALNSNLVTNEN